MGRTMTVVVDYQLNMYIQCARVLIIWNACVCFIRVSLSRRKSSSPDLLQDIVIQVSIYTIITACVKRTSHPNLLSLSISNGKYYNKITLRETLILVKVIIYLTPITKFITENIIYKNVIYICTLYILQNNSK